MKYTQNIIHIKLKLSLYMVWRYIRECR